jgi:hypothetical protein
MIISGIDCEYMPIFFINKILKEQNEQNEVDLK